MSRITPMGLFHDYEVIVEVVRAHFTYFRFDRFDMRKFPMYAEQFLTDVANIPTKPLLCSNSVSRSALSRPFCIWTSSERLNVFTAAIINAKATNNLSATLGKKYAGWTTDFINERGVPTVWSDRYNHKIDGEPKKYFDNLFSQTDYTRCFINHSKLPVKVLDAALYKKWDTLLSNVRDAIIDVMTKYQPAPEKTPTVPNESADQVNLYESIPKSNNKDLGEVIGLKN